MKINVDTQGKAMEDFLSYMKHPAAGIASEDVYIKLWISEQATGKSIAVGKVPSG